MKKYKLRVENWKVCNGVDFIDYENHIHEVVLIAPVKLKEYSSMFMTVSCLIKYPSEKFTYSDKERWQLAGLYKKEIAELFYHLADQFKKC